MQPRPDRARRDGVVVSDDRVLAADGVSLYVQDWTPVGGARRGVYLLHGLGEHVGRHDALARWWCARGWHVRAHDHVGHGRSGGRRGVVARPGQLAAHARARLESFAAELDGPPVLLGHSLGGALATELVACGGAPVAALVLSSPALGLVMNAAQRLLATVLGAVAPRVAVRSGLDPQALSHDPAIARAYRDDPLVHDRVSAGLVRWLRDAGRRAHDAAPHLAVPTLLLVAGADRLVDPEASVSFAHRAPPGVVKLLHYDGLYHELFHERGPDRARVFDDLEAWLATLPG